LVYKILLIMLLFLTGCASVDDARTPQQKNLNASAFDILSSPADDFIADLNIDEFLEDETDKESIINENFYKTISISVTENMKMREVLTQMAGLAGINIYVNTVCWNGHPTFLEDLDNYSVIDSFRVSTPQSSCKFRSGSRFQVFKYATIHRLEPAGAARRDKEEFDIVRCRDGVHNPMTWVHA
jgi:hypothetical protein